MKITPGQIVKSKAGRDTGRKFIIIKIINENYVFIVDGDLRKIEKPKRKKIKHLELSNFVLNNLILNQEITNSNIRKVLKDCDIS